VQTSVQASEAANATITELGARSDEIDSVLLACRAGGHWCAHRLYVCS
jgi:hypothetical protein